MPPKQRPTPPKTEGSKTSDMEDGKPSNDSGKV